MNYPVRGIVVTAVAVWGVAAPAADHRIVLREHLNAHWRHEPVTYPFSAPREACAVDSLRLTGPTGPVAVQLSGVERWPGTPYVKSARLSFVVTELPPLATHTYTARYDRQSPPDPPPEDDLRVSAGPTEVEAVTRAFGMRLLLGQRTYDPPAAAQDVPGPVVALRRANGSWFGGSRLYGETPVTGFTATLTDRGPVFARVAYRYTYADGNALDLAVTLHAQGKQVFFEETVAHDKRDDDGWELRLTPGLPALVLQFMPEVQQVQRETRDVGESGWKEKPVADYPAGVVTNLAPWGDWWNEFTQTAFQLKYGDEDAELFVARQDAGAWVKPGGEGNKLLPLVKDADGSLSLRVTNAPGQRKWSVGENPSAEAKLARLFRPSGVIQDELDPLDQVKEMVLDWPAAAGEHPRLILDAAELRDAAAANPAAFQHYQDVKQLREMLGAYAYFDTMRNAQTVICLYDGIIDSDLITPEERTLFRAQMAFLAYRLASPANWSAERGFASGNKNMTLSHIRNLGLAACVLREHPLAKTWIETPRAMMDTWLSALDDKGYWNESGHYGRLSASNLMFFAIALKNAGFQDAFRDPRMKNMALFYEKTLTPPDPQRILDSSTKDEAKLGRLSPPIGRGSHGSNWGLGGLMAKEYRDSDPAFSRIMQWSFEQSNFSTMLVEGVSGLDVLSTDRTLPAAPPTDWGSEFMPSVGPLLRSGVATPEENYLWFVTQYPTNPDGEFWPSEVGALLAWWAKGRPISRRFPSVPDMNHDHGLLCNRVMLATNWKSGEQVPGGYRTKATQLGFTALPRVNYFSAAFEWQTDWMQVSTPKEVPDFPVVPRVGVLPPVGKPPVTWQRQGLWVYDDGNPGGVQYLVLRDTVSGGQPTQWQFWTTSEKIGTLDEVRDREAFLSDRPGPVSAPVRPLWGDRFTAIGQLGVDVHFYIAAPTASPRHTLRYSTRAPGYRVRHFQQAQDLLHLQLPGDGAYFVAICPCTAEEEVPAFATLGDGTIIKASGAFGTDHVFLAATETEAAAEDVSFRGTVASVQARATGITLALGGPGSVRCREYELTAPLAVSLAVTDKQLTLHCPAGHAGARVTLRLPGTWRIGSGDGATAVTTEGATLLTLPAGLERVILVRT